jgi:hypothetical protein
MGNRGQNDGEQRYDVGQECKEIVLRGYSEDGSRNQPPKD